MLLVEDDVLPITIPEAIESLTNIVIDIVRKNRTLVDYYIYPRPTPSEIEAYKPRLQLLYGRLESLSTLDLPKLTLLVDDAAALMSASLLPIIDQLLNAVHGIQQIFINHYDRDLEQRKPYGTVYDILDYRWKQLERFQRDQIQSAQRLLADDLNPVPPSSPEPSFCRFAVAFTNGRDFGKLSQVLSKDLRSEDMERLHNDGGAFLSWDCPGCAFKVKYYIINSMGSHIHATDDVRSHSSVPEVEYRPSWLVKCHLHQAKSTNRRGSHSEDQGTARYSSQRNSFTSRAENIVRRQTEIQGSRASSVFNFDGMPRRTKSETTTLQISSLRAVAKERTAVYGCPFCWMVGKEYGHMGYCNARDLVEHISVRHNVSCPPPSLVLEKYMIGLNGKCAESVRRWDLNIKSTY